MGGEKTSMLSLVTFEFLIFLSPQKFKLNDKKIKKIKLENLHNVFYSIAKWQEETHCFFGGGEFF